MQAIGAPVRLLRAGLTLGCPPAMKRARRREQSSTQILGHAQALGPLEPERAAAWSAVLDGLRARLREEGDPPAERRARQDAANPAYVPRNAVMQDAIRAAEAGSYDEVRPMPRHACASVGCWGRDAVLVHACRRGRLLRGALRACPSLHAGAAMRCWDTPTGNTISAQGGLPAQTLRRRGALARRPSAGLQTLIIRCARACSCTRSWLCWSGRTRSSRARSASPERSAKSAWALSSYPARPSSRVAAARSLCCGGPASVGVSGEHTGLPCVVSVPGLQWELRLSGTAAQTGVCTLVRVQLLVTGPCNTRESYVSQTSTQACRPDRARARQEVDAHGGIQAVTVRPLHSR